MSFKPSRLQLEMLTAKIQNSFSSEIIGKGAAAQTPGIIASVSGLISSAADLVQLGDEMHTILMSLPSCTEQTVSGQIERFDLSLLRVRANRVQNLAGLMTEFAPGHENPTDCFLMVRYKGPCQPFGVLGEYFRAVLPVNDVSHAYGVLVELGVASKMTEIGLRFIEVINGVNVWGNISRLSEGKWQMVLEVHDPQTPYIASFAAFTRACRVNEVLARHIIRYSVQI